MIEHGIMVDAPTHIPNSPLTARNSPKLVARLSTSHANPVMVALTTIIFFGLIRSASQPMSGPVAPPVSHPIEKAIESFVRDHPKCFRIDTKNTEPELIAPQMKNIVTKIASTMIHPRRSCSVIAFTTDRKPSFGLFDFGPRKSSA